MPILVKAGGIGPHDGPNYGRQVHDGPSVLAVVKPDNNLPRGLFDLSHSV